MCFSKDFWNYFNEGFGVLLFRRSFCAHLNSLSVLVLFVFKELQIFQALQTPPLCFFLQEQDSE